MASTEIGERRADLKAQLLERLHDPLQLRILLIGVVLLAGYAGVYTPLTAQIAETTTKLNREQKLADLAASLEQLKARCGTFAKRIPQQADCKEWIWIQYMREGIRRFPLKLTKLDYLAPRQVGPYKAAVMAIVLEGSYFDLDQFLRWLETSPRLLRVDDLSISLSGGSEKGSTGGAGNKDDMIMQLTLLGLGS
jgi:Tfp pilus assembly protein PilO